MENYNLSDQMLCELLVNLESERVERKAQLNDSTKKSIREAICAFANDLSGSKLAGVIFIGAKDDGSPANIPITDDLIKTLADMKYDGNIVPLPILFVEKKIINNAEFAVVTVAPSLSPPVRYNGTVYIRTGSRKGKASAQDEIILNERRRNFDLPYDIRTAESADISDLDLYAFEQRYLSLAIHPEVLEENNRTKENQLSSLRFFASDRQKPTHLGLLTIGKDPTAFIPGAYIQFVRFDGKDPLSPIINEKVIKGNLISQLDSLDTLLAINIQTKIDFTSANTEIEQRDYPLVSLQQIARNAIMHRQYEGTNAPIQIYWFSNRVEISSPGGLFGRVNYRNFGQPGITDYRNPHIAEVLKNLNYVQRFGVGIIIAKKYMQENGNPEIEFNIDESRFLAILPKALS